MAGGVLRCSSTLWAHRLFPLIGAVVAIVLAASLALLDLSSAAPEKTAEDFVESPEDFAGVYLDRYVPADNRLRLAPLGKGRSRAYTSYYLGLLKEASGDAAGAVDYYRQVLEEDPSAAGLANRAAYIAAQNGDIETGLEILTESLRKNPGLPECHVALSRFHSTYTDDPARAQGEATRLAEEALAKFPENPGVIEHLIQTHIGFGAREKAEIVLETVLRNPTREPLYWLRLGKIAQHVWPMPEPSRGDPVRINEIYEKALSLAPTSLQISEDVADYFYTSGQYERATEIYEDIIEQHPDCIAPREKLGNLYFVNGKEEKELEILTGLLERHPDRPNIHKRVANIYEDRADRNSEGRPLNEEELANLDKAIVHYERALRIAKGEPLDYLLAAVLMLRYPGKAEEAVKLLERARFHHSQDGSVTRLLGIAYVFNQQYAEAISAFEETINLVANAESGVLDDELFYRYGGACERLKQYDKAAELFRKAITLVPEDKPTHAARIYNYLGYMWLEQNMNIDEAGDLIIKANELIPDDSAFIDSLGWFYFMKGRYEEALEALLRVEGLLGEEALDAVVIDHIAQTYYQLGQMDKAIAYGEKAIELDPETKDYKERLEEFRKNPKEAPSPPSSASEAERE